MNMTARDIRRTVRAPLGGILLLGFGLTYGEMPLEAAEGRAQVTAVQGRATVSEAGRPSRALEAGLILVPGAVLTTGPGAAVEIDLGSAAGRVRLTEQGRLTIATLEADGGGEIVRVGITLEAGAMIGVGNHVTRPSQYQVKLGSRVAATAASQFRLDARGFVVVLDGALILAGTGTDGEGTVKSELMQAPPAVFYAPGHGVQAAPAALVSEVLGQATARIGVEESPRGRRSRSRLEPAEERGEETGARDRRLEVPTFRDVQREGRRE